MKEKKQLTYLERVHRDGRILGIIMALFILAYPIVIGIIFKATPQWSALGNALLAVVPTYWTTAIIEVLTFIPMLGAGGTYLSFVTGNISNLKLPCAVDAMERANVKSSTEEGEIISTISIAVSSIVTTVIVIIGVILILPLQDIINSPVLTPAFDMLLPALFGGLAVVFVSKNVKLAAIPLTLMIVLFVFVPALNAGMVGIMAPVGVIFTLIIARIMYKKGII